LIFFQAMMRNKMAALMAALADDLATNYIHPTLLLLLAFLALTGAVSCTASGNAKHGLV
jgi:hypothetical protein